MNRNDIYATAIEYVDIENSHPIRQQYRDNEDLQVNVRVNWNTIIIFSCS
jgi:hypothetical protein